MTEIPAQIPILRIRRYALIIGVGWTLLVLGLFAYNLLGERAETVELARTAARGLLDRDLMYRRWVEGFGGVFVDAKKVVSPSLSVMLPNADVETTTGMKLTRLGWASMVHGVYSLASDDPRMHAHLTSLKPIRPDNAPDPWETAGLREFEQGAAEKSEVETSDGALYLRFMRRLVTEQSCLQCHAQQGYKVGDVRGAVTLRIPLELYAENNRAATQGLLLGFGGLWLVGLLALGVGTRRLEGHVLEREQILASAQESHNRYRLIAERTREGFWLVDASARLCEVNDAYCRMSGYSREELLTMHIWQVSLTPRETVLSRLEVIRQGKLASFESRHRRKDGTLFDVDLSVAYLAGDVDRTFAFVRDISDRRRAEEALRESEARYRALFHEAAEGILVAQIARQTFTYANPAICRMFGYTETELRGMGVPDIHPPGDVEWIRDDFMALARGDKARSLNIPCLRKDGTTFYADISATPAVIDGEECSLGFFTDVTERKQAEDELRTTETALKQAQKMEVVGRLAGGIAHDFNNVLTAIFGYTQLAADELPEGSPIRMDLAEVYRAGETAALLTKRLLAFSRKQTPQPTAVDLNTVVTGVERMLRPLLGDAVQLVFRLFSGPVPVKVDTGEMEQVIMNLVVNAKDAMPEGGTVTLETASARLDEAFTRTHPELAPGDYFQLTITDTGTGMDAETLRRMFEPFFTTKEIGHGTGLGLATVYRIVTQSGGYVSADSQLGRGSTFTVLLPRTHEEIMSPHAIENTEPLAVGSETILLVEDEAGVRRLAHQALSRCGYNVLEATDGDDAIRVSDGHAGSIELLLTDIVMPRTSGPVAAERVRMRRPTIKVLYMSGYTASQMTLDTSTSLLAKPFTPRALARAVREALDAPSSPPPPGGDRPGSDPK